MSPQKLNALLPVSVISNSLLPNTASNDMQHRYRSYENCRRPGVAILDMQMSKVPIISGYDSDPYMDRLRPSREYT